MIRILVTLVLLGGCTQMQSARVLRPGTTRVSAGIARASSSDDTAKLPFYFGELRVAHGIKDGVELGIQLGRSAGLDENISALGIAPKVRVYETFHGAISVAAPAVVAWEEHGTDFTSGTFAFHPTVYVGLRLEDDVELVLSPRGGAVWRSETMERTIYMGGVAAGFSFGAWGTATIQPEIGITILRFDGSERNDAVFTIGVGVTGGG